MRGRAEVGDSRRRIPDEPWTFGRFTGVFAFMCLAVLLLVDLKVELRGDHVGLFLKPRGIGSAAEAPLTGPGQSAQSAQSAQPAAEGALDLCLRQHAQCPPRECPACPLPPAYPPPATAAPQPPTAPCPAPTVAQCKALLSSSPEPSPSSVSPPSCGTGGGGGGGGSGGGSLPTKPVAHPGVFPSFDAFMEAIPQGSRALVNEWRLAEYNKQLSSRNAEKYLSMLEQKERNMTLPPDINTKEPLDPFENEELMWGTDTPLETLAQLERTWRDRKAAAVARMLELRERVKVEAAEKKFELPFATAPLPRDRPLLRSVNVSFMLLYYKHPDVIKRISDALWQCTHGALGTGLVQGATSELLVNADSRGDGDRWDQQVKEFEHGSFVSVVLSNNLHEVHGYNRLASMARGQVLVLLQDDELPPEDQCAWVDRSLRLFQKWPRLGALGHRDGLLMYPYNVHHDFFKAEFPEKDPTQCANGVTLHRYGGPTHRDAELELPFTFVAVASFSPFSVRAEAFADIGMMDEAAADPGECGIQADWELSMRFWWSGWQVGILTRPGGHPLFDLFGQGGTHVNRVVTAKCWGRMPMLAGNFEERKSGTPEQQRRAFALMRESNAQLEYRVEGPLPWERCCLETHCGPPLAGGNPFGPLPADAVRRAYPDAVNPRGAAREEEAEEAKGAAAVGEDGGASGARRSLAGKVAEDGGGGGERSEGHKRGFLGSGSGARQAGEGRASRPQRRRQLLAEEGE